VILKDQEFESMHCHARERFLKRVTFRGFLYNAPKVGNSDYVD